MAQTNSFNIEACNIAIKNLYYQDDDYEFITPEMRKNICTAFNRFKNENIFPTRAYAQEFFQRTGIPCNALHRLMKEQQSISKQHLAGLRQFVYEDFLNQGETSDGWRGLFSNDLYKMDISYLLFPKKIIDNQK